MHSHDVYCIYSCHVYSNIFPRNASNFHGNEQCEFSLFGTWNVIGTLVLFVALLPVQPVCDRTTIQCKVWQPKRHFLINTNPSTKETLGRSWVIPGDPWSSCLYTTSEHVCAMKCWLVCIRHLWSTIVCVFVLLMRMPFAMPDCGCKRGPIAVFFRHICTVGVSSGWRPEQVQWRLLSPFAWKQRQIAFTKLSAWVLAWVKQRPRLDMNPGSYRDNQRNWLFWMEWRCRSCRKWSNVAWHSLSPSHKNLWKPLHHPLPTSTTMYHRVSVFSHWCRSNCLRLVWCKACIESLSWTWNRSLRFYILKQKHIQNH